MFQAIEIPYECVMLFNVVDLKPGVTIDDVELLLGEMCNVVKNNYGTDDGGFVAGQVFRYAGFISDEGSVTSTPDDATDGKRSKNKIKQGEIAIVTYWRSFELHERSHADQLFKEKFDALVEFCDETYELGYELLWQGTADRKAES